MKTDYSFIAKFYSLFHKYSGFERGLHKFISDLNIDVKNDKIKILDAGCGTGILGLSMLNKIKNSSLILTDLEPKFFEQTNIKNISDNSDVTFGISNISVPNSMYLVGDLKNEIKIDNIDIICIGAVFGYSDNVELTLDIFLGMLNNGGTLINIEMDNSFFGKFIAKKYSYPLGLTKLFSEYLDNKGLKYEVKKLGWKYFPVNLTRKAFIVTKK